MSLIHTLQIKITRPHTAAALAFVLSVLISAAIVLQMEHHRVAAARADLYMVTSDQAVDVEHSLDRALSATYGLAALVQQSEGKVTNFEAVATKMLPNYPGASILILAPGGIISHAIPKAGNERAIGLNLLQDPVMQGETQLARSTGKLTLAGPLALKQGGVGLVARLPIFLDQVQGSPVFWGFTNVVLRFPQVLESTQLSGLAQRGVDYKLWRVNPENGQCQTIIESGSAALIDPVRKSFAVPNGAWTLSAAPRAGWGDPAGLSLKIGVALALSLLLAYLAKLKMRQLANKANLERQVILRTAEIRASELQLAATLDAIPDLLFEMDIHGRYIACHAPRTELLVAPVADLIGKRVSEDMPPAAAQTVLDALQEAHLQGLSNGRQFELSLPVGVRWFELSIARKPVAPNQDPRFIVISHDVTARKQAQLALQQSENYARAIVQTSPACVKLVARDGTLLAMNPAGLAMVEADSAEAVIGQSVYALMAPEHRAAFQAFNARICSGETGVLEFEVIGIKGSRKWLRSRSTPFSAQADAPLVHLAITDDITERKRADEKLQLAASVFSHAREGIMITDAVGRIIEVNDTFIRITGYDHEEAVGQNPRLLRSDRHTPDFYVAMWQALLHKGHWYGEVWNRRKNGDIYITMQTISAVRNGAGVAQHYVALFSDITLMKNHQRQLEHIAHYDALTNLPNRLLLADRLQHAMVQAERKQSVLAVAYLDLDGFKVVNDTYGHGAGDELLVILSQRMKEALRESDTLARIGGDEFVAVLVDLTQTKDCELLLERLLKAASSSALVATKAGMIELRVSASVGVTLYPQDHNDADLLLRHADQAMYIAKQSGKNRFHLFDVAQDTAVKTHHESREHIRGALERQEFVLFYQPKVNMKTGVVVGAEALIRWQHPERGLLAPAAFLPVIEDHPLSIEVGEWVIATALSQMSAWQIAGLHLPVSVNIGAHQLQNPEFAVRIQQLLAARADVRPQNLQFEVLETSAIEDVIKVGAAMKACHTMGVGFALDDFGTGYSSLTYLKRLPAETLKIDQSFVRDMLDDPNDLAIVSGVIGLATAFKREVIAEGVETAAHGRLLLSIGCELAQGYGIARPMPAADLPAWVARWQSAAVWTA